MAIGEGARPVRFCISACSANSSASSKNPRPSAEPEPEGPSPQRWVSAMATAVARIMATTPGRMPDNTPSTAGRFKNPCSTEAISSSTAKGETTAPRTPAMR